MTASLLDAALAYAARGWPVFPCHTPTDSGCSCRRPECGKSGNIGKHPRTQHGLKDATTDEATIRRWWRQWPEANVAIRTGAVSGVVVLDEDTYKGGDASREALEHTYTLFPETMQQLTGGGGVQYFFAHPGTPVHNGVETLGVGLDIRGDGGYVIAPPSFHASGKRYAWELTHHPEDTPLAVMPPWLLALCQDTRRREAVSADEPIAAGARNATLFQFGCSMRARGFPAVAITAALAAINQAQCQPPLDAAEVEQIAASCARYETGPRGAAPGPEPPDKNLCPALPDYAQVDEEHADGASLFLNDYIDLSKKWAPRAYEGFHEAVALFVLSTVAARRIRIEFGPRSMYTSLYMALTARTTLFTKTTAADIGLALLETAGLAHLLADDDATPQAFLRSLTRYVPSNYEDLSEDDQQRLTLQMAFTAQRGWFYEEWGQHLEAMMQKNGFMASFRGILRRLDDHKSRYVYTTISRGSDVIHKPYLTLLANVTPADLQPFVKAGSSLWRDGYIARMAFVTPDNSVVREDEFTPGAMKFPRHFSTTLTAWHKRLGIPWCTIAPSGETKGKGAPAYKVTTGPLPEKVYTLSPAVRAAYYAYDKALRQLTRQRTSEDLDGSYGRFPIKALRIAGLLASLHDDTGSYTIWPSQWARGQQIAEHWRRDLHRLRVQVRDAERPSRQAIREETVLRVLREKGAQSVPWLQNWTKWPYTEVITLCEALVSAHVLTREETAKTVKYAVNGIAP